MEISEAEISVKKERDRDKRLRKTYGITLAQYSKILAIQDGKCAICGRNATDFKMSLNVDHMHFRVHAQRSQSEKKGWTAGCVDLSPNLWWGQTKIAAISAAKEYLMPLSIRGLLCPGRHGKAGQGCCNRLLGRVDNREWLQSADRYLENPPARKVLTSTQNFDSMCAEGK